MHRFANPARFLKLANAILPWCAAATVLLFAAGLYLALLGSLSLFHGLGCPVLLGASRKSFIGRLTGAGDDDRMPGSLASALVGASQGTQILRVHDVAATRQALTLWQAAVAGQ